MRAGALLLGFGLIVPVDHGAIQDALAVAHSSIESTHRRFHADYHFPVNQPPVDFVSIVSPFRRLVLSAESGARSGRRMFGQREALGALQPDPERLEVFVELTLHPHNTFVGVPDYTVQLEPRGTRGASVAPLQIDRLPRYGPRVNEPWYPFTYPLPAAPGLGEPVRGGTLIARFDSNLIDPAGTYAVTVIEAGRELARVEVNLARLR